MEAYQARLINAEKYNGSSLNIKNPKGSPYIGTEKKEFKPNHNNTDLMKSGKKADFQGQLLDSSVKFNLDKKAMQMKYANNASGGHGESDMVYNVKADRVDSLR